LNKLDNLVESIFDKIRKKIISKGISGILSLGKFLRICDIDNTRKINYFDFSNMCFKYGFGLNDSEIKSIFSSMDLFRTCFINYDEFMQRLRGYLNPFRQSVVEKAFYSIDKFKKNQVDYFDICEAYDASKHPMVKSGKESIENIYNEFLNSFQMNHSISALNKSNFIITIEEFIEYNEYLSLFIENDQYFSTILGNCWKINPFENKDANNSNLNLSNKNQNINNKNNGTNNITNHNHNHNHNHNVLNNNYNQMKTLDQIDRKNININIQKNNQNYSNYNFSSKNNKILVNNIFCRSDLPQNIIEKAEYVLNKFRHKLISIGQFALFNLTKQFQLKDIDNLKSFNYDDMVDIAKEFKIDLSQSESINLFKALDKYGNFYVETQSFLNLLKGEMNERRKNIIKLAFKILDVENKGSIDLAYLKRKFNVRYNIDVLSGKKSEEEAFGEFQHSLEYHFSSYREGYNRKINLEQFIDFYNMVSFCIENDQHFEVMIKSTWKF
jgi:Ca2+-binding EF-hand superfamily protein